MVRAYCLIATHSAKAAQVVEHVKRIKHVKNVDLVAGEYDIIADIEAPSLKALFTTLFKEIANVPDVRDVTHLIVLDF